MSRINKILIGALVAQIALIVVVRMGSGRSHIAPLTSLIDGFSAGDVSSVSISGSGKDAKSVTLTRKADGWVLSSHFDYPADGDKVDQLLDKIAGARARTPVTRSAARHRQLKVAADEFDRKIELGGTGTTVFLGAPVGARKTAVRLDGHDEVMAVGGLSPSSARVDPAGWIDTQYFHVDEAQISRVSIVGEHGEVALVRDGEDFHPSAQGQPIVAPKGKQLDMATVKAWVRQAATIRAREPADPAKAPSKPAVTVTIEMKAPEPDAGAADAGMSVSTTGDVYVLELAPVDDGFWVRRQGEDHAVLVAGYVVDKLAKASISALWKDAGAAK